LGCGARLSLGNLEQKSPKRKFSHPRSRNRWSDGYRKLLKGNTQREGEDVIDDPHSAKIALPRRRVAPCNPTSKTK
jgi:hypothetical protein